MLFMPRLYHLQTAQARPEFTLELQRTRLETIGHPLVATDQASSPSFRPCLIRRSIREQT